MQDRRLYESAMFWVAFGGPIAAIGGIVLGIGVVQVGSSGNLFANAWFAGGAVVVIVGGAMLLWAGALFTRHRRENVLRFEDGHSPSALKPIAQPRLTLYLRQIDLSRRSSTVVLRMELVAEGRPAHNAVVLLNFYPYPPANPRADFATYLSPGEKGWGRQADSQLVWHASQVIQPGVPFELPLLVVEGLSAGSAHWVARVAADEMSVHEQEFEEDFWPVRPPASSET